MTLWIDKLINLESVKALLDGRIEKDLVAFATETEALHPYLSASLRMKIEQ